MELKNRASERAANKRYYEKNKERHKANVVSNRRFKKYGITEEAFQFMLDQQGGACAICRKTDSGRKRWSVDHCHITNRVRGVLCTQCNTGLGLFKDSPALLRNAAAYLIVNAQGTPVDSTGV